MTNRRRPAVVRQGSDSPALEKIARMASLKRGFSGRTGSGKFLGWGFLSGNWGSESAVLLSLLSIVISAHGGRCAPGARRQRPPEHVEQT